MFWVCGYHVLWLLRAGFHPCGLTSIFFFLLFYLLWATTVEGILFHCCRFGFFSYNVAKLFFIHLKMISQGDLKSKTNMSSWQLGFSFPVLSSPRTMSFCEVSHVRTKEAHFLLFSISTEYPLKRSCISSGGSLSLYFIYLSLIKPRVISTSSSSWLVPLNAIASGYKPPLIDLL